VGAAEHQGTDEGHEGPPLAEVHNGDADESAAHGHVVGEDPEVSDREVGASQRAQHAAQNHAQVADRSDVHSERVGGFGILTDGTDLEAQARSAQDEAEALCDPTAPATSA